MKVYLIKEASENVYVEVVGVYSDLPKAIESLHKYMAKLIRASIPCSNWGDPNIIRDIPEEELCGCPYGKIVFIRELSDYDCGRTVGLWIEEWEVEE